MHSPEAYRKYFCKSPEPAAVSIKPKLIINPGSKFIMIFSIVVVARGDPMWSSRARDFSSQISALPGPQVTRVRAEGERKFNESAKNITNINKFTHASYYQQNIV